MLILNRKLIVIINRFGDSSVFFSSQPLASFVSKEKEKTVKHTPCKSFAHVVTHAVIKYTFDI